MGICQGAPAGEQPRLDMMDWIVCGENVGGGESKRFKWRQVEGWRGNKVSAVAKGWHDEERAGGKETGNSQLTASHTSRKSEALAPLPNSSLQ